MCAKNKEKEEILDEDGRVRIMTWNIQQFSKNKADKIDEAIVASIAWNMLNEKVDVLIILELKDLKALNKLNLKLVDLSGENYQQYVSAQSFTATSNSGNYSKVSDSTKRRKLTSVNQVKINGGEYKIHSEYYGVILREGSGIKPQLISGDTKEPEFLEIYNEEHSIKIRSKNSNSREKRGLMKAYELTDLTHDKTGFFPLIQPGSFTGGRPPCLVKLVRTESLYVIPWHLRPNNIQNEDQARKINEVIEKSTLVDKALVLTGDFNIDETKLTTGRGKKKTQTSIVKKYLTDWSAPKGYDKNPTHLNDATIDYSFLKNIVEQDFYALQPYTKDGKRQINIDPLMQKNKLVINQLKTNYHNDCKTIDKTFSESENGELTYKRPAFPKWILRPCFDQLKKKYIEDNVQVTDLRSIVDAFISEVLDPTYEVAYDILGGQVAQEDEVIIRQARMLICGLISDHFPIILDVPFAAEHKGNQTAEDTNGKATVDE